MAFLKRPARRVRAFFLVLGLLPLGAAGQPFEEYEVKAAFLFRLGQFVTWPAAAFKAAPEEHVYCVLGRGPMEQELPRALAGKTIGGRHLRVRLIRRLDDVAACQVLFMSHTAVSELARIADGYGDRPILLVGESPCFASQGGMIHLAINGDRIRLEINSQQAATAGLEIRAQLLHLSTLVDPEESCED